MQIIRRDPSNTPGTLNVQTNGNDTHTDRSRDIPSAFDPVPQAGLYDMLIIDSDRLQGDLLELFMGQVPEIRTVGVTGDIKNTVDIALTLMPDVVLIDTPATADSSPVEIGRAIRKELPRAGIVILADRRAAQQLSCSVFDDGPGWSFILKDTCKGAMDLVQIVLATASGTTIIDPIYVNGASNARPALVFTDKQREVMGLVVNGLSNEAIAKLLGITVRTVEYHLNEVYRRLDHSKSPDVNPRVLAATYFVRSESGHALTSARDKVG